MLHLVIVLPKQKLNCWLVSNDLFKQSYLLLATLYYNANHIKVRSHRTKTLALLKGFMTLHMCMLVYMMSILSQHNVKQNIERICSNLQHIFTKHKRFCSV